MALRYHNDYVLSSLRTAYSLKHRDDSLLLNEGYDPKFKQRAPSDIEADIANLSLRLQSDTNETHLTTSHSSTSLTQTETDSTEDDIFQTPLSSHTGGAGESRLEDQEVDLPANLAGEGADREAAQSHYLPAGHKMQQYHHQIKDFGLDIEDDSDFEDNILQATQEISRSVQPSSLKSTGSRRSHSDRLLASPSPRASHVAGADVPDLFAKRELAPAPASPKSSRLTSKLSISTRDPREQYMEAIAGLETSGVQGFRLTINIRDRQPLQLSVKQDCTTHLAIGYALLKANIEPGDANLYNLSMVEDDGEIDEDFASLNRTRPIASYDYHNFAIVKASEAEFRDNSKKTPNKISFKPAGSARVSPAPERLNSVLSEGAAAVPPLPQGSIANPSRGIASGRGANGSVTSLESSQGPVSPERAARHQQQWPQQWQPVQPPVQPPVPAQTPAQMPAQVPAHQQVYVDAQPAHQLLPALQTARRSEELLRAQQLSAEPRLPSQPQAHSQAHSQAHLQVPQTQEQLPQQDRPQQFSDQEETRDDEQLYERRPSQWSHSSPKHGSVARTHAFNPSYSSLSNSKLESVVVKVFKHPYKPLLGDAFWVDENVAKYSRVKEVFEQMCKDKMMDSDMYVLRKTDTHQIIHMSALLSSLLPSAAETAAPAPNSLPNSNETITSAPLNNTDSAPTIIFEMIARRDLPPSHQHARPRSASQADENGSQQQQPKRKNSSDILHNSVLAMQPLGFYKYPVLRRQPMNFLGRGERELVIDGQYIHIMPPTDWSLLDQPKTTTFHIRQVLRIKHSRKLSTKFTILVMKPSGPKSYALESTDTARTVEIVDRLQRLRNARTKAIS